MKPHITIILLCLAGLIWGCQDRSSGQKEYGKSKFVPIKELTADNDFQDILLDHGIRLFHSDVIAYEGQIIISSRGGKLLSLTMDGEVKWLLVRQGKGPGEFEDPHDMQIADDMIGILDKEKAQVSLYSIEGQFYKNIQFRGSADQFGMVDGGIHIFYSYHNDFLFARYDIETGEEQKYGDRNLLEMLPEQVSLVNFMFYSNILQVDDQYTIVGLVHYAQVLIYDREKGAGYGKFDLIG